MKKILAIDDIPDNLIVIKALLSGSVPDAVFLTANSGAEGLALCAKEKPDVILLDILMPGMDGYEVCRILKKTDSLKHIPVVFITAESTSSPGRIRALEAGADAFLAKPVDQTELTAQIRAMLRIKEAEDKKLLEKEALEKIVKDRTLTLEKELAERKKAEALIKMLAQTVRSISECISITDIEGNIIFVNNAFVQTYGYTENELIGNKINIIISGHDNDITLNHVNQETIVGGFKGELLNVKKNGEIFPVYLSTSYVTDDANQIIALVGVTKDITEQKITEKALEKRIITLTGQSGSVTDIRFDDLFSLTVIQKIQDAFSAATGVASIITDEKGIPITRPSNFCYLCEGIIRQTEKGLKNCQFSDAVIGMPNPDGPNIQKCLSGGLWDGGAAIMAGNHHIANWLIGQVLDDDTDPEQLKKYAAEIGADEDEFSKALKSVPHMSHKQFSYVSQALYLIAEQLSALALQNMQQARSITEGKRSQLIQSILYNISDAVTSTADIEQLIQRIQQEIGKLMDATNFFVALYDESKDELFSPFFKDEKDQFTSWPASTSITGLVIKQKKSLLLQKADIAALRESGAISQYGSAAEVWLGVPLVHDNKAIGAFVVQSYTNPLAYDQKSVEMLEFVSDQISLSVQRKKAEQDVKQALDLAREADRLKSAFLATMSHELRTPLNAIIGFSSLINQSTPHDSVLKFVDIINKSGEHLQGIVEDMFDITLIESGQFNTTKETINLHLMLSTVYDIILIERIKLNKQNLHIGLNSPVVHDNLQIISDHKRLQQILINLLKNALKFTTTGKIEFGYTIVTENEHDYLEFFVEDTGIGISHDKHDLIFEIFRQVDDTHTRLYGGVGIGLSVAKKYVEKLGGKIWLKSEPGKGTVFNFTIPLVLPETKSIDETKKITGKHHLEQKTILVADDDEASYLLLLAMLGRVGIKVLHAADGKMALKQCLDNQSIDLVLMDLQMPELNGYEATRQIKKTRPLLPIIAQTAFAIAGDRDKALAAQCDDYISKPIKQEILMGMLLKWLT
jgi:PAS domain S-box-containing protein